MFPQFIVKFLKTSEMLPIIKVPLIISVTAFNIAIVPRCSRRNKLMLYSCRFQCLIKGTFFGITYVFVIKLCSVVGLNCLYFKRKYLLKHFKELYCIFGSMLFKAIYEAYSCTFIYCCPLIQMLFISL